MKTIYKYALKHDLTGITAIDLPKGAQVLSVQMQNFQPHLWVLIDPNEEEKETRVFVIYGTGKPLGDNLGVYIGTYQQNVHDVINLVWHLFEQPR